MAPDLAVAAGRHDKLIMKYDSIDQILEANDRMSERLKTVVEGIAEERRSKIPDGEKWSINHIVEHLAMVEHGMTRICAKLLGKAESAGTAAAGISVSENFIQKGAELAVMKVKAPEIVEPTGTQSIEDSFAKMEACREAFHGLRQQFETLDGSSFTFPHPYLGELTAIEWLVLAGEHKRRHTRQIKALEERL